MSKFAAESEDGRGRRQAILAAVAVVCLGVVGWRLWAGGEDPTEVRVHQTYFFTCVEDDCGHTWQIDLAGATAHFGGGQPSAAYPVLCEACERRSAFMNDRCPWCEEPYVADFRLEGGMPREVICPHCGKDTLQWSMDEE